MADKKVCDVCEQEIKGGRYYLFSKNENLFWSQVDICPTCAKPITSKLNLRVMNYLNKS